MSGKVRYIEYERIIFHAASNGKLYRLKVFLDHQTQEEITPLVSAITNGSTPLVMACKNGHPYVVSYLIERCHADIEQTGSIIFDGQTVQGAPPLWCAAAAGHLNIVKFLLKFKASVNSTTKYNSTPLRAACFDGHFEIVKYLVEQGADIEIANKHGHTCLMIACHRGHSKIVKYLVERGADVNRKSDTGNTALHDCASSGSLDLFQLLVLNGATLVPDSNGKTPILSAALSGHSLLVNCLVREPLYTTKQEKINALEVLGATFIDDKLDIFSALECWRRAMKLRNADKDCPIEKPLTPPLLASYVENAREVRTLSEIVGIAMDINELRMQSLLVRERVLGAGFPDNLDYIWKRGRFYAETGDFGLCMQLWRYALDVQQNAEDPLSLKTTRSLLSFVEIFSMMMSEARGFDRDHSFVSFRDIFWVFEKAVENIEKIMEASRERNQNLKDLREFPRSLQVTMHLVGLICKLRPHHMTESEELEFKKALYKLVQLNPIGTNGWTPLHIACDKDSSCGGRHKVFAFPSLEVVDLLLEVGASPNALDFYNNTPLHIAAMDKPFLPAIFNTLLNHGAHLDQRNHIKRTPLELAERTPSSLDIHPLGYVNLQCMSAKAIQSHKVPYKGLVPKELEVFIDVH